jgi:hypothetical protein
MARVVAARQQQWDGLPMANTITRQQTRRAALKADKAFAAALRKAAVKARRQRGGRSLTA